MSALPETVLPRSNASLRPRLPARHDHVGSFLRPDYLLAAREQRHRGEIDAVALRTVEDRAITEIARFQESVGLKSITDGEYRRSCFHIDFLDHLQGVETTQPRTVTKADGSQTLVPPLIRVTGPLHHAHDIEVDNFRYLRKQVSAGSRVKVAIPSPTMLHFRGGRDGISRQAYPALVIS